MRTLAALVLSLGLAAGAAMAAPFTPTTSPIGPDGTRATVDLPASKHMKNVGGRDGAGLCVFTSLQHAAYWQAVRALDGFREWMRKQYGGGWPDKVDDMLAGFCREKGVAVPPYAQHTGGDVAFLETALKTGRVVCVTYAGRDDFYSGKVAHMVNLAHLDATRAAIIDNNRPGVWLWMSRADFLARWRDMRGGWAIVLLDAPPAPYPAKPEANIEIDADAPADGGPVFGQCPGGVCPIPARVPAIGPAPVGPPPTPAHEWGQIPGVGWGWVLSPAGPPAPAAEAAIVNHGVDYSRIRTDRRHYHVNGVEVTRAEALEAMGGGSLSDDSDRWNLSAVGDAAFLARVRADVAALPAEVRGKLHVQAYTAADWQVSQYKLSAGVTLRRPSVNRVGAELGVIPGDQYGAARLADLIGRPGGPAPRPVKPVDPPAPPVDPKPGPPPCPCPAPCPCPSPCPCPNSPTPPPAGPGVPLWVWLAAGGVALLILKRKEG